MMVFLGCYQPTSANGTKFGIMLLIFVVLSLPKAFLAITGSIIIRWARAVAFLSLLSTT